MRPKTIAVCFQDEVRAGDLAQAAAALARHHDAHLLGLWVMPGHVIDPGVARRMPRDALEQGRAEQRRLAERVEAVFLESVRRADVRGEWRAAEAGSRSVPQALLDSARAAELILMRQPESHDPDSGQLHVATIRGAGRPVLIVPPGGLGAGLHRGALIGWSPTREGTRAAFDALALLQSGARVRLLHVGDGAERERAESPMNEMAAAIDRHGFAVTISLRSGQAREITQIIEQEAAENGAEFIATGAFGQSMMYDFVIGAVTWNLIRHAARPVLMSK